jgi:hypothetical protein
MSGAIPSGPYTFMACTDTTLTLHKQKHRKVEKKEEIKYIY